MIYFDSHKEEFRNPIGPVTPGTNIAFHFIADNAKLVLLRIFSEDELFFPMEKGDRGTWSVNYTVPEKTGLIWYDFTVYSADGHAQRYGNSESSLGGVGKIYKHGENFNSYQITVYQQDFHTPQFLHGACIYQIMPDRFYRGKTESRNTRDDRIIHKNWNDDVNLRVTNGTKGDYYEPLDYFGGNLAGIEEKLPYIKSLGINVIYLNPVFESSAFHHYDTGDYTKIDSLIGTEEEFNHLVSTAKEMGISIMMDGVFSHTGSDSIYFNRYGNYDSVGAYQDKKSRYYDWYTFKHFPNDYVCWWNMNSLPACDKTNLDYQKFILDEETGIVPMWIKKGSSGWRLDVADELPIAFLKKLRIAAKKVNPDAAILGEVWEDASNKVAYGELRCYCTGDTLDSVMNYPLREAILSFITKKSTAYDLELLIKHQAEVYPVEFLYSLMNLLGSHDRARALNILCGKDGDGMTRPEQQKVRLSPAEYALAVERYKKCVDIICALPGCPTIYYGDEAGMTGCPDPFNRRPFPWGKEDELLQKFVSNKLNHHNKSNTLKYGYCDVKAEDENTITIKRYLTDTDAFGNPTEYSRKKPAVEIVTVTR